VDRCEVVIVGGGPGGASCAWGLRRLGLDAIVVDRKTFPRDKICAGWITPQVCEELEIDLEEYAEERVLQPIHGFRVSRMGDAEAEVDYAKIASYGIRRCEFDDYLLARSGARLRLGESIRSLERTTEGWRINGDLEAKVVVGAGGHFCPVVRAIAPDVPQPEPIIAAQEIEFRLDPAQAAECNVRPEMPELFFTRDLRGYGWVFRKGDYLNVGLGRQDREHLSEHVTRFVEFLERRGRIPRSLPSRFKGHAYLLYGETPRPLSGSGFVLVGDAAGLAYPRSGEGIRPAVESGLLAAQTLFDAKGIYDKEHLGPYTRAMESRFGPRAPRRSFEPTRLLPPAWRGPVAGWLLGTRWFADRFVISRWFLHRDQASLPGLTAS
jgi:geranylgeranyl reductase family protein